MKINKTLNVLAMSEDEARKEIKRSYKESREVTIYSCVPVETTVYQVRFSYDPHDLHRNIIYKDELLSKWWDHYEEIINGIDQRFYFSEMIRIYGEEKIWTAAVILGALSDGTPSIILKAMQEDKLSEMFSKLPKIYEMSEAKRAEYEQAEEIFISKMSSWR